MALADSMRSTVPLASLCNSQWFKLICGASHHHAAHVRGLALIYTLAGADCIDVAADPAIVSAAREGVNAAMALSAGLGGGQWGVSSPPWLMVSVNDGEDPHFRKAWLDSRGCPTDCHRPCERVCPVDAIDVGAVNSQASGERGVLQPLMSPAGIDQERCYGCGRCLSICPFGLIEARSHQISTAAIADYVIGQTHQIDAIEIHTQVGHLENFKQLWHRLKPGISALGLVAISCPSDQEAVEYLKAIADFIQPQSVPILWQADGRPMSGDIGKGTTNATLRYAQQILESGLPGFVQLAGGTNGFTVGKARQLGLLPEQGRPRLTPRHSYVAGVAYGGYARQLINASLEALASINLSAIPSFSHQEWAYLSQAVTIGLALVQQLKGSSAAPLTRPDILGSARVDPN